MRVQLGDDNRAITDFDFVIKMDIFIRIDQMK